jgi:hypothetical protein
MVDVIADRDILAQQQLSHPPGETGAFILHRSGREIVKQRAN